MDDVRQQYGFGQRLELKLAILADGMAVWTAATRAWNTEPSAARAAMENMGGLCSGGTAELAKVAHKLIKNGNMISQSKLIKMFVYLPITDWSEVTRHCALYPRVADQSVFN